MKRIAAICTMLILCAMGSSLSQDYWQSIGPDGGGIYIVKAHPRDSTIVYCASSDMGFYLSTDQGATWEARRNGLLGLQCRTIGPHPMDPNILYIGFGSCYKTTDMGLTWSLAVHGLEGGPRQNVYSLAVDGESDTLAYAGTYYGVYRTTDGGQNWEITPLEYWTWDLEIDLFNASTLLAATDHGIYKSSDFGNTWELKTPDLDVTTFVTIAQTPSDSMRLYIAGASDEYPGRIYKTTDRGETWEDITDSLGVYMINDLAASPTDPERLYACVYQRGIYTSTDGGSSWERTSEGIDYFELWKMSVLEKSEGILFTSDRYRGGVYRSTDFGESWKKANSGIRLTSVTDLEFFHSDDQVLLCSNYVDGLKRYHIEEKTWEDIAIPCAEDNRSRTPVFDVCIDPGNDSTIYLAADCGVLKSTDSGLGWANIHPYPLDGYDAERVLVHPLDTNQIACLSSEDLLPVFLKSTDEGVTWIKTELGIGSPLDLISDPSSTSIYYLLKDGSDGVYKTTDGGSTWDFHEIAPPGVNYVRQVMLDRGNPEKLYAPVQGEVDNIYVSTNGGINWEVLWQVADPWRIVMDPTDPLTLYCWTRPGGGPKIYKTTDGGQHWMDITFNAGNLTLIYWAWDMKVHPGDVKKLYVGTNDAGVLVLDQSQVGIDQNDPEESQKQGIGYDLHQNYPNPFNPSTTIEFNVSQSAAYVRVKLEIYDLRGRLINTLVDGVKEPGRYTVQWDGEDAHGASVGSGIYLCRIAAGDFKSTRKLILIK